MKHILKHIKEEITRLREAEYDAPEEILSTLKDKLQMDPIERFVEKFKSVNSIPPSYRVFLHNGQHFDVVYESFSLMVNIKGKEYYMADLDERGEAVEQLNRLLTINQMVPDKAGEHEPSAGGGAAGMPKLPGMGGGKKPPTRGPAGGAAKPPTGGTGGAGAPAGGETPPPKPEEPKKEPEDEPMV